MGNMKYLFFGLALIAVSYVDADDDDVNGCLDFLMPANINTTCCKDPLYKVTTKCDKIDIKSENDQCKFFKCYLQERGLIKDGKITKGYLQGIVEGGNNDGEKDRLNYINTCFELVSQYKDIKCPEFIYGGCVYVIEILSCKKLDNNPVCIEKFNKAKACVSANEEYRKHK